MSDDEIRQSAEQGHCSAYHTLMLLDRVEALTGALKLIIGPRPWIADAKVALPQWEAAYAACDAALGIGNNTIPATALGRDGRGGVMKIHGMDENLLSALRNRGHTDQRIEAMNGYDAFHEFCMWHGLIGWGHTLWEIAIDCGIKDESR